MVHRRVISLKFCCMLACLKSTTILCATLRHSRGKKKNPFTHCENIVTVWSQCVLHCGPCFWLLWCSLLVLLLFWGNTSRANHRLSKPAERDFVPLLVGLCDCGPAGGRIAHYRECLNVQTRIEMPLTCRLRPAALGECACIYFWGAYAESNKPPLVQHEWQLAGKEHCPAKYQHLTYPSMYQPQ